MSKGLVNPRIVCGGSRVQGMDAVRMVLWVGINPGNGLISVLERSFSYPKCLLELVREMLWTDVI